MLYYFLPYTLIPEGVIRSGSVKYLEQQKIREGGKQTRERGHIIS